MREILFNAKRKDNKQWTTGGYFNHQNRMPCPIGDSIKEEDFTHYIFSNGFADWNMARPIEVFEVEPETVCEYTGYDVENGRVFEKHIIGFINYFGITEEYLYTEGVVTFIEGAWKVQLIGEDAEDTHFGWVSLKYACRDGQVRIVGNTLDNPERLSPDFWDKKTPELLKKWSEQDTQRYTDKRKGQP